MIRYLPTWVFLTSISLVALVFGPPSGYFGERAWIEAEEVYFLDLSAAFPTSGVVEVEIFKTDGDSLRLRESFFHNGHGRMRFHLPPMTFDRITIITPDRNIHWESVEVVALAGGINTVFSLFYKSPHSSLWIAPSGSVHVPHFEAPVTALALFLEATYLFTIFTILLFGLSSGIGGASMAWQAFSRILGGSGILTLLAISATFL